MTSKRATTQLSPAHIHAIGVVGVLALVGVGYALGYAPSSRAQHQAELQRKAITKANDEASATAQHIEIAQLELETLEAAIKTPLVASGDLVDILTDAATARSLAAHDVVADDPTTAEGLLRTAVVIHASGGFSDITGFITDLRESHPNMVIDGFSIMPEPMGANALAFQASLSVYAPQAVPSDKAAEESSRRAPAATSAAR